MGWWEGREGRGNGEESVYLVFEERGRNPKQTFWDLGFEGCIIALESFTDPGL